MHRFRLILLPLCLFATATAIGQTVTGRIVDERQQPVAGVAVVMQTPDSVYVDAVASDLEGRFAIASDVRPYRLLFQHLSYDPLTVERSGDDAGTVTLTEATNLVDEVVVRGERPLVKVEQGRLSYDLQVAAQGKIAANAYEALTKLPGVSERDGALTLAGAAGVTVILNGKPSTMTAEQLAALLKSTPVEQVEKVEVLYAAPPQYHIRGAAINVVLRRRFGRSFSGQVNGTYEGGYYHSWGTGASAVYSTPTLSVDALYRVGEARSMRKLPLTSQHTVGSDTFDIRQEQRLADDNLTHNLRTGLSWKTSEKSHIDLAYTASFTPSGKGDISATATTSQATRISATTRRCTTSRSPPPRVSECRSGPTTRITTPPAGRRCRSCRPTAHLRRSAPTPDSASTASRSRSTRATTSAGSGHSTTAPASSMSATTTTSIIRRKRR